MILHQNSMHQFLSTEKLSTLHNYLYKTVHIQVPTQIKFDKIVSNGIITDTVFQRKSKATDMASWLILKTI